MKITLKLPMARPFRILTVLGFTTIFGILVHWMSILHERRNSSDRDQDLTQMNIEQMQNQFSSTLKSLRLLDDSSPVMKSKSKIVKPRPQRNNSKLMRHKRRVLNGHTNELETSSRLLSTDPIGQPINNLLKNLEHRVRRQIPSKSGERSDMNLNIDVSKNNFTDKDGNLEIQKESMPMKDHLRIVPVLNNTQSQNLIGNVDRHFEDFSTINKSSKSRDMNASKFENSAQLNVAEIRISESVKNKSSRLLSWFRKQLLSEGGSTISIDTTEKSLPQSTQFSNSEFPFAGSVGCKDCKLKTTQSTLDCENDCVHSKTEATTEMVINSDCSDCNFELIKTSSHKSPNYEQQQYDFNETVPFEQKISISECDNCDWDKNIESLKTQSNCDCSANLDILNTQSSQSHINVMDREKINCTCSDSIGINTVDEISIIDNYESNELSKHCFDQLKSKDFHFDINVDGSGDMSDFSNLKSIASDLKNTENAVALRFLSSLLNNGGSGFSQRKLNVLDSTTNFDENSEVLDSRRFFDFFGSGRQGRENEEPRRNGQNITYDCVNYFLAIAQNENPLTKPNLLDIIELLNKGPSKKSTAHEVSGTTEEFPRSGTMNIDQKDKHRLFFGDPNFENDIIFVPEEPRSTTQDSYNFNESINESLEEMKKLQENETKNWLIKHERKEVLEINSNSKNISIDIYQRSETSSDEVLSPLGSGDLSEFEVFNDPCFKMLSTQNLKTTNTENPCLEFQQLFAPLFGSGDGRSITDNLESLCGPRMSQERFFLGSGDDGRTGVSARNMNTLSAAAEIKTKFFLGSGDGIASTLFGRNSREIICNQTSKYFFSIFGSGDSRNLETEASSTVTTDTPFRNVKLSNKVSDRRSRMEEQEWDDCDESECFESDAKELLSMRDNTKIESTERSVHQPEFDCPDESCFDQFSQIESMSSSVNLSTNRRLDDESELKDNNLKELESEENTHCTSSSECSIELNERCISAGKRARCDCGRSYTRHPMTKKCKPKLVVETQLRFPNEKYDDYLSNKTSLMYKEKKFAAERTLRYLLEEELMITNSIVDLQVVDFTRGSLVVHWNVVFASQNKSASAVLSQLGAALTKAMSNNRILKKIPFQTGNMSLLSVDLAFNPCDSPDLNYCSPNADCFQDKDRASGFYCQCRESHDDVSQRTLAHPGEICQAVCSNDFCGEHGICNVDEDRNFQCSCIGWYVGNKCQLSGILIISCVVATNMLMLLAACCVYHLRKHCRNSRFDEHRGILFDLPENYVSSEDNHKDHTIATTKFRSLVSPAPPEIILLRASESECSSFFDSTFNTTPSLQSNVLERTFNIA